MDVKELRRLLRLMKDFDLSELEIEEEGNRFRARRGAETIAMAPAVAPAAPAPAPGTESAEAETDDRAGLLEIPSPMVGTFYRASSPEAEAFVQVGDMVGEETVVCIIEAMKVMNEIKADEIHGEILEILVNNAEAVEFGQPLFLVRPTGG